MKRAELIELLETVQPALAANDIIPIMTHYWFTGKAVVAWNGHVGISAPFETDFTCAVPGTVLALLKVSKGDVEVTVKDDMFYAKGPSTKIELPTMAPDLFNFRMPKFAGGPINANAAKFLKGVGLCIRSLSIDGSVPDHLGVTFIPSKGRVTLFTSDSTTVSRALVNFKSTEEFDRVIMPPGFCKQLLVLANEKEPLELSIKKDSVNYRRQDGVRMYGTPVASEKPRDFVTMLAKYHPEGADEKMVEFAGPRMSRILDRACIIALGEAKMVRTKIRVTGEEVRFTTKSRLGTVDDKMKIPKGHKDVEIEINAKAMRAGCEDFNRILIIQQCVIMSNGSVHYLISGRD